MIRPWEYGQDRILSRVRDCSWAMARQAFIEASREFFQESKAWLEYEQTLETIEGLPDYAVRIGQFAEVVEIRSCKVGVHDYIGVNEQDFRSCQEDDPTKRIASWFDDALWIGPTPIAGGLIIRSTVALKPMDTAPGLPIQQYKRWFDSILPGVLHRLHSTPERPYTNPAKAAEMFSEFQAKKAQARSQTAKGGFSRQRVVGHYF